MNGLEVVDVEARRGRFRLGPLRLEVPRGTATALLGPSGAGKTTLLRAVAGFQPLENGSILMDGERIDAEPPDRRGLGFVPPDLGLFPHLSVRRNVRYPLALRGAPDRDAAAKGWMERFDLGRLADRFPHELSSGEQQRVAMARALAAEPRLLLWDEPLAALDVESREVLLRLLVDLIQEGRWPLLLVTHDPATALALADRLVVLEQGRVAVSGPAEVLGRASIGRFVARFLGYENLYSRAELERSGGSLGPQLLGLAGPGGLAVSSDGVQLRPPRAGRPTARVLSLRWSAAGWTVIVRDAGLSVRTAPRRELPTVRVGDPVEVSVDPSSVRPLEASPEEGVA